MIFIISLAYGCLKNSFIFSLLLYIIIAMIIYILGLDNG
jgi:hypothetical protein